MMIAAFFIFVFGVYWFVMRWRNKVIPDDHREFGARIGRSVHAAVPIPGLAGQSPADILPGPYKESIGPEESHTLVLDATGRPVANDDPADSTLGPYRDPDLTAKTRGKKRSGKKRRPVKATPSSDA